jgi:hypothetical protein
MHAYAHSSSSSSRSSSSSSSRCRHSSMGQSAAWANQRPDAPSSISCSGIKTGRPLCCCCCEVDAASWLVSLLPL